jgi:hypothetical protein
MDAQAAQDCGHGIAGRDGGQDDLRAAQLLQFRGRVLRPAVDVSPGAQGVRQRLFIRPACDGHRLEAHLRCKLDPQMAESAQAEHRHQIASPRAAVAETVERGDAGAHQRRRLHRRQFLRHARQRFGARDGVIGIAAVAGDAGDVGGRLAGEELAPAAVIAIPAISAVPAETGALAGRPSGHAGADCIYNPDDLMSWNPRVRYTRKVSFLGQRIAVTDSASLHLDSYRSRAGIRDLPFHDLKGSAWAGNLHRAHLRHMASNNDVDTLRKRHAIPAATLECG